MRETSEPSASLSVDLQDPTLSIHNGGSAELWDKILSQEEERKDENETTTVLLSGLTDTSEDGNARKLPPSKSATPNKSQSKSFTTYRTSPTFIDDADKENTLLYPPLPTETCDEHEELLPSAFLADNDDADALQDAMKVLMRERQERKKGTDSDDGIIETPDVEADCRFDQNRDEARSPTDEQSESLSIPFSCES